MWGGTRYARATHMGPADGTGLYYLIHTYTDSLCTAMAKATWAELANGACNGGLSMALGACAVPPSKAPTYSPSKAPTKEPTYSPTKAPTKQPTYSPTRAPTTASSSGIATGFLVLIVSACVLGLGLVVYCILKWCETNTDDAAYTPVTRKLKTTSFEF